MDKKKAPAPNQAYDSDIAYLEDELRWVKARATRLALEVRLESVVGDSDERLLDGGRRLDDDDDPSALRRARTRWGRREKQARGRVDERAALSRDRGPGLAMDRLCALYDLSPLERTVLLLAVGPCFSNSFQELIGRLDPSQLACSVTIETAFAFAGVELAASGSCSRPTTSWSGTTCTRRTFAYLIGDERYWDDFLDFSSVSEPRARLGQVVIAERDKERILSWREARKGVLPSSVKTWGSTQRVFSANRFWPLLAMAPFETTPLDYTLSWLAEGHGEATPFLDSEDAGVVAKTDPVTEAIDDFAAECRAILDELEEVRLVDGAALRERWNHWWEEARVNALPRRHRSTHNTDCGWSDTSRTSPRGSSYIRALGHSSALR